MKAVLIGATGATGSELLQLLLQDDTVTEVVALVRKDLHLKHEKLMAHIIDFDRTETWQHLVVGDVAFSCLGTTLKAAGSKEAQYKVDYEYQYAFAKAAKENDITKFILISAGMANEKSLVFYSKMKGALEHAIQQLKFHSLIIFRPGLLSRPATDRMGEKISEAVLKIFNCVGLLKKFAPLPVKKLAMLMLEYAKKNHAPTKIMESSWILKEIKSIKSDKPGD